MIALTPRQHDALAAYATTGSLQGGADLMRINIQTMKNHITAALSKSDGAQSTVGALFNRGWVTIPERPRGWFRHAAFIPARPVVIPARGFVAFSTRSGTDPGGPRDCSDPSDEGPAT